MNKSVSTELRNVVEIECTKAGSTGASIGIVRGQSLAWAHGYGFVDLKNHATPNEDTVYRIASITKTFTATAIFQLRDQGKLSIDDPLATHIPEFSSVLPLQGNHEEITLRRVMCHVSGLAASAPVGWNYVNTLDYPNAEAILAALPQTEIVIEPDSAYKYSNLGFALLGEVIRRVSGQSYEDYVSSMILEPLSMSSTVFEPEGDLVDRTAVGYDMNPYGDHHKPAATPNVGGYGPAGQLYSTVRDLAMWLSFQLLAEDETDERFRQILSARSRREMQRPQFLNSDWSSGQCMPWFARRKGGEVYLAHPGGTYGYQSLIIFSPNRDIGAIVLSTGSSPTGLASKLLEITIGDTDSRTQSTPRVEPSPPPENFIDYLGLYVAPWGDLAKVENGEGRLRLLWVETTAMGGPPTLLDPTDEPDLFRATSGRAIGDLIRFARASDGAVNGFAQEAMFLRKLVPADD